VSRPGNGSGADKVFFDIAVRETTVGGEAGSVDLRVKQGTRNQATAPAATLNDGNIQAKK